MKKKTNLIIAVLVILIASMAVSNALAQEKKEEKKQVTQVLIKNVNIFDGNNEKPIKGQSI